MIFTVIYLHIKSDFSYFHQTCLFLTDYCMNISISILSLCLFQGEGADGQGPSWLPGRAGHPAAVGRWRTPTTDHQPGHQLCLWPVSLQIRVSLSVCWSLDNSDSSSDFMQIML